MKFKNSKQKAQGLADSTIYQLIQRPPTAVLEDLLEARH